MMCQFCKRFTSKAKGGWCPCCFSLWYDGGPEFQNVDRVREVSLRNPVDSFAPVEWPLAYPEVPDFDEFSNYWGE